jgi:hypothetical protein
MVLESQKEKKKVKDREYEERKLNEERKIWINKFTIN